MKNLLFVLVTVFGLVACGGGGGGSSSGGGTGGSGGNRAPSASFTVACADLDCTFTNNSTDSDGTVASSSWNFGDGATATTTDANHTFGSYGSYTVSLTVTDNDGATGSTTRTVTVAIDVHAQIVSIDMFDESIVFKQDFNHRMDGEYTFSDLQTDLGCSNTVCSDVHSVLKSFEIENGEVKATFAPDTIGGIGTFIRLSQDYDELYLTFTLRFDNNYDYTAQGGKLMGLGGEPNANYPPTGCVEVTPDSGFSTRYMYRAQGSLIHYTYHQDKSERCGDSESVVNAGEALQFQKGTTYTIEMRTKMNTPGVSNGIFETRVNGVLLKTDAKFMFSETGIYGINGWLFQLYLGGSDASWEVKNDSTLYLDNFVLSTERVVE